MTKFIPEGLTQQHVLSALDDLDYAVPRSFGAPTRYELIHDGGHFPPTAVIGLAFRYLTGRMLRSDEFSGGDGPGQANYVLRGLGFDVVEAHHANWWRAVEKGDGFVTSTGVDVPTDEGEMADKLWFNVWRRRPWPWREVQQDDKLYWYDTTEEAIVWQSRVHKIERFEFVSKDEVSERLQSVFGVTDLNDLHLDAATDHGYCIAYKVNSLVRLNVPKPSHYKFPHGDWLHSSDENAQDWFNAEVFDDLRRPRIVDDDFFSSSLSNGKVFDDLRSAVETYEKSGSESDRAAAYAKVQKIPDISETAKHIDEMVRRLEKATANHKRRAARGIANKRATSDPTSQRGPKPTPPASEHADGRATKALSKAVSQATEAGHFCPESLKDEREMRLRDIVERRGQPAFRNKLIAAYGGRCAVTGCNAVAALEAAHIRPYTGPKSDHITNGLLLRADIHTLFDLDLIGIDPETLAIALASAIKETAYSEFRGKMLAPPANVADAPNHEALVKRWKLFGGAKEAAE